MDNVYILAGLVVVIQALTYFVKFEKFDATIEDAYRWMNRDWRE